MRAFRLLWIVPEEKGGIRSYSETLWPSIRKQWPGDAVEPFFRIPMIDELERLQPDLIHVQHEFGLFGSKTPGFYLFPRWIRKVRKALPRVRIIATAHHVLGPEYQYPYEGRGWQIPLRFAVNHTALPLMRRSWLKGTWGRLDGTIIHSDLQKPAIEASGCPKIAVIPHFVPPIKRKSKAARNDVGKTILVFGYFTPDKGQDIVIDAMTRVDPQAKLILAGGVRRDADQGYLELCRQKIEKLGLSSRIEITGFVSEGQVDSYYEKADLVVAPFRETTGSGSLVQAFARGAPVLASDLPLNREIGRRQAGSLEFFRSENPADCAQKINQLLADPAQREQLAENGLRYAESNSTDAIAEKHLQFYKRF